MTRRGGATQPATIGALAAQIDEVAFCHGEPARGTRANLAGRSAERAAEGAAEMRLAKEKPQR